MSKLTILTDPFGLCPEGAFNGFDGHDLLDLIGLFFDGADLVNALWYLAEGDVKNALMSAGALLPVVGLLGVGGYKLAKNGIKLGKKLPDAAKYTNKFTKFANDAKNTLNKFGNKFNKVKDNVKNAFKKSGDIGKGAKQAAKADKAKDTAKAAAKASAKNADEAASAAKAGSKSGTTSFGSYSTKIDSKVTVVEKQELPSLLVNTYKDGQYRTVVTNEDIIVYRSFGYDAEAGGAFATSNPSISRVQTKVDCAILPEWKNTLRYEAKIVVPKGTTLNIGRVGEQYTMSGARLAGGADQFLLPQNWDLNWIKNIRRGIKP